MDIDYALGWDFIDIDGRPLQLRFRRSTAPGSPEMPGGTGQLIAVVAKYHRPDHDDVVSISRPGVPQADVDAALQGWQDWATLIEHNGERVITVAQIRRRIHDAHLD
jgi:hypothetical protein